MSRIRTRLRFHPRAQLVVAKRERFVGLRSLNSSHWPSGPLLMDGSGMTARIDRDRPDLERQGLDRHSQSLITGCRDGRCGAVNAHEISK